MGALQNVDAATIRGRKVICDATAGLRMSAVGWSRGRLVSMKPIVEWLLVALSLPVWGVAVGVIWLAVKISDPGHPAFFVQWRTGYRGTRFRVFKIRTMVPGAARLEAELRQYNLCSGPQFKMINDPRVTHLGRLLRKLHLDELPQLFNVLTGSLSLVGTRPSSAEPKDHKGWWRARLLGPPGATGLFQIYRTEAHSFDERARLEIAYMRGSSFWLDVKILAKTFVVALIRHKGI